MHDLYKNASDEYRDLFHLNPLPMWVYDDETLLFMEVNEAAIAHYGYTREEFLAMKISDIRPMLDQNRMLKAVEMVRANPYSCKSNWRHLKKDGVGIDVEIRARMISYNGKKAVLVLSNDITTKQKFEEVLKIKNEELKKLSGTLIMVRESERKNLAMEVHEELGQLASAIKMDLDWIKMRIPLVEKTIQRIDHAVATSELLLDNIRRLASSLRPGMLDELGLNAALNWLCDQFSLINNIPCVFEQLADDKDVTIEVKTQLYRICEESLANSKAHAAAGYVNVILRNKDGALQLCITDDGVGFDMAKKTKGIGLIIMRERAHSIDGKLTIISKEGKGTSIYADIPFTEELIG